jgi:hypothetical protein
MRVRGAAASVCIAVAMFGCGPDVKTPSGEGTGSDAGGGSPDAAPPPDPFCGDGVIQPPETCDPPESCPLTCPPRTCQVGTPSGSLPDCLVVCNYEPVSLCAGGDGCCGTGCTIAQDGDCVGIRIDANYASQYQLEDLGPVPGVPTRLGGVVVKKGDPSKLLVGGGANTLAGALYEIGIVRDPDGHIAGFDGTATRLIDASYIDGGLTYGPGDVLFLSRWPANELGQTLPGSTISDKVIDLEPLGVAYSLAGVAVTPPGYPGAGSLKLMSWSGGQWYSSTVTPSTEPAGTFDLSTPILATSLPGGPEGMIYVPLDSPLFPEPSVLVSEYTAGAVSTYRVDADGNPISTTRRLFVIGLQGAEGATIDPTSGDFLFSTFGGGDRIIVVHGFAPIR